MGEKDGREKKKEKEEEEKKKKKKKKKKTIELDSERRLLQVGGTLKSIISFVVWRAVVTTIVRGT